MDRKTDVWTARLINGWMDGWMFNGFAKRRDDNGLAREDSYNLDWTGI